MVCSKCLTTQTLFVDSARIFAYTFLYNHQISEKIFSVRHNHPSMEHKLYKYFYHALVLVLRVSHRCERQIHKKAHLRQPN